jgi:hypothetical protein
MGIIQKKKCPWEYDWSESGKEHVSSTSMKTASVIHYNKNPFYTPQAGENPVEDMGVHIYTR